MNGRIFDPVLARFLSADPNIDGVSDSQGYNRYSYVLNNPLNATDPTGYLSWKQKALGVSIFGAAYLLNPRAFNEYGVPVVSAAVAIVVTIATKIPAAGGAAGGAVNGFFGSMLNGANVADAFKSGLTGAATGAATAAFTAWASDLIGGAKIFGGHDPVAFDPLRELGRAAAHGLVGGAVSQATGGEFRHGFYGSAASSMFSHSPVGKRLVGSKHIAVRTATAAAVGGTVSALGGGKFANGAVTSAFQHLYNYEMSVGDNCYSYAIEENGKITPGEAGGMDEIRLGDGTTMKDIDKRIQRDNERGNRDYTIIPAVGEKPEGARAIFLAIGETHPNRKGYSASSVRSDFHAYKQLPDGTWSSKIRGQNPQPVMDNGKPVHPRDSSGVFFSVSETRFTEMVHIYEVKNGREYWVIPNPQRK